MPNNKIKWDRHSKFLLILAALYLLAYIAHPAVPGKSSVYPLGWWGWFDQGEYLKAAKAFANLSFISGDHYYPPLYPLLGAAFVGINPMHAFIIINIACFILFAHFFVLTASRFLGWWWSVAVFVFSYTFSKYVLAIWAEPWTSSLVSAIFAFLLEQVDHAIRNDFKISKTRLALWSALGGAVFLTRPADAVVITPLFCYVLWCVWSPADKKQTYELSPFGSLQKTAVLFVPGLIGIALFAAFNLVAHGSIGGRYFAMAETNGMHLSDFMEKTVSLLLDAGTIYNTPEDSIFKKVKWLALFVPAVIYGLISGHPTVKIIIVVVFAQLLIYFPYADLIPNGVWKYHNIHYFKWVFPYAALLIVLLVKGSPWFNKANRASVWYASVALGVVLLCLQLRLDEVAKDDVNASVQHNAAGEFLRLSSNSPYTIDKVSIPQLSGEHQAVYFSTKAKVIAGGQELKFVRDFRFLPSRDGVDLVFIRPVKVDVIDIHAGDMRIAAESKPSRWFIYSFTFGVPAWLH